MQQTLALDARGLTRTLATGDVPVAALRGVDLTLEPEEDGEVLLVSSDTLTALIPNLQPVTYKVMMRDESVWDDLLVDVQAATNFGVDVDLRERAHDIDILKSVGMTPRQVIGSVASGTGLLTALAIVVGIPLGLYVYRVLFVVGEHMAGAESELYAPPSWIGLALIVPGALIFAALCAILPARRAAGVKVTDVLRYE